MDKFQTLLQKAKDKKYQPILEEQKHDNAIGRVFELMFLHVWIKVKSPTLPDMVFIEGFVNEEQIDMMLEEIEKI